MMRRALQLAANGRGHVSPNPMVGAIVVAPDGRIIGEGWHRRYGGPHAEVNAMRAIAPADRILVPQSTIYVTLEPCSHYGKTPPCAKMLVEEGIGRVVVGCGDPNPRVAGRGIAMLRQAGIPVVEGVLEDECRELNRAFMTAHSLHRPYITLKWAQSADGYMDHIRGAGEAAARFSTSLSTQIVHWRRACHDAIAVGATTALRDNPRLDVRVIWGRAPRPVLFDRHGLVSPQAWQRYTDAVVVDRTEDLAVTLEALYSQGITSLLVEGGASLLNHFIAAGIWDEAHVEIAPVHLKEKGATRAPGVPVAPVSARYLGPNLLLSYVPNR